MSATGLLFERARRVGHAVRQHRLGIQRDPSRPLAAAPGVPRFEPLEPRVLLSSALPTAVTTPAAPLPVFSPILPLAESAQQSEPTGITPSQMVTAYGVNQITFSGTPGQGQGQTIAIVDAENDPTAVSDLSAFSSFYNLPQMNQSGGPTFKVLNQNGQASPLPVDSDGDGWSVEESLDIEWAHSIAPQANIILFEANSADDSDLNTAVATAAATPGVVVVSMSWGGPEAAGETSEDSVYTTPNGHNGVTFVAATGDYGEPGGYPAYSLNVVAVGGTTLTINPTTGAYVSETGWGNGAESSTLGGSGGGISQYESQPSYQNGVVTQSTTQRTIPDVAMDADPNTGVPVYDTSDFGISTPWEEVGGTSLATPMFASIIAIADQGRVANSEGTLDGPSQTLPMLYSVDYSLNFHDITSGNNGYAAGPGYDLVTGLGSPIAQTLVGALTTVGPAARVRIKQQPTDSTEGNVISPAITVAVEDANGNIEDTNTSSITLAIAGGPGGATLSGTTTEAAVAGIATFSNLSLNDPGTYTLRATDSSLTSATSVSFTVAGPATQVAFVQEPEGTTVGTVVAPTVSIAIEDANGFVVTDNTSGVTLGIASGPSGGGLEGTVTVSAVDGVASFNTLALSAAGVYTLRATDGGLTAATTASFTVLRDYTLGALAQFDYNDGETTNGSFPDSGLIIDSHGNLFGTTALGGDEDEDGTIFEVAAGSTAITTLALFNGADEGGNPIGDLVMDSSGDLFGTTTAGGEDGYGTVFELPAGSSNITALASFNNNNGADPYNGLVIDSHGNLYGDALYGGDANDDGTIYEVAAGSGAITALALFDGTNGANPVGDLIMDSQGNLYGTTAAGGSAYSGPDTGNGVVFEVAAGTGTITDLAGFNGTNGADPEAALLMDSQGNLYGTATEGGADGVGTVFELGAGTGTITALASFNGTNGSEPVSTLVMDSAGNLYGSTYTGGDADGDGVIFALPAGGNSIIPLGLLDYNDGSNSVSGLVAGPGGVFYGTAQSGGNTDDGTVFELSPIGASQLAFVQQPTSTGAGQAISPGVTVDVEDASGNLITSDNSTVTLSINTGPGGSTLGGTVSVAAVDGVATFSNLSLNTAGTYTLEASDGLLSSATSSGFTISAGAAAKLVYVQPPTGAGAGSPISPAVTVAVEDDLGNIVTGNTSSVSLAIATGPGGATLGGTTTVAAVNGVATFANLSLNEIGDYTLQATDGALASVTSGTFDITAGAPNKLVIAQQPTSATAGVAIAPAVTVDVEDSLGNIVTTNSSTVTLSIDTGPSGGTLGGTATASAVDGVATFSNLVLDTAGSYTLLASDGALTTATSSPFTINPAAAAKLGIVQGPGNTTAGVAITPAVTVAVEDTFGNVMTGNTSTVTVAIATGPTGGMLGGTTGQAAVGGVATFSGLVLDTAGSYTLSASDASLVGAVSTSFTVSAAAAAQLVFVQQPTSNTLANEISPAVTVDVEDAFGNVVAGNSSTVTLAVDTGPTGGNLTGTTSGAAVGGVAAFSNVGLNKTGTYTIEATDGSLTAATSGAFTIVPAYTLGSTALLSTPDGTNVSAAPVMDSAGDLFDSGASGGANSYGAVFEVAAGTSTPTLVASFSSAVGYGGGALVLDASGDIFGTASGGTNANGTVFEIAAGTNTITVLAPFNGTNGETPNGPLLLDSHGNLFGVTTSGGTSDKGTVFEVAAGTGAITSLASFDGTDGLQPGGSIAMDANGDIFGATEGTSTNIYGTLFELPSGTGVISNLATFTSAQGQSPYGGVTMDSSGNLYGTAYFGGADNDGTVFELPSGSGTITALASFNGTDGHNPNATVVLDASGNLYGTTIFGGGSDEGVAFELTRSNNDIVTLASFAAGVGPGLDPDTGLLPDGIGDYYGVTALGAAYELSPQEQLAFVQQPTNTTAGVSISPAVTVDVEDPNGNLLTTNTSNVTVSVDTGPGTLTGITTVQAVDGVAEFSTPFLINTAGTYTLKATDGNLTAALSDSFTVNPGPAAALAIVQGPSNATAGATIAPSVTVAVEDALANVVTSNTSTVTFAITSGPTGAVLGGTTSVAASDGVATFSNLDLTTAGTYTLTASDGALAVATSTTFTISPATATKLGFVQAPSNTTAGAADAPPVTVAVEDRYGNVITSNTTTITAAIATGPTGGTLGGTTSAGAVAGVATFSNLLLDTAGSYTLTASDPGAPGLTAVVSGTFTVGAAAPAKLVILQGPGNAQAGVSLSPALTVAVEDTYGNVATSDTSDVSFAIATGPTGGVLGGTTTAAAAAGIATFGNLSLNVIGTYTLTASDASLTTATTSGFTISAGPAAQLAIVHQPGTTTAGVAISPAVTVDVEDQFGNVVTSNATSVSFTIATGPSGATLSGTSSVQALRGVATFSNLVLDTAGAYTLTAGDAALTTATTNSFTVNPAIAAKLAFAVQPTGATAGVVIAPGVTVDVEDAYGNIITTNTSGVTIAQNTGPSGASVGGTVTVAAVAGVATFSSLVIDTAGTFTLKATDAALNKGVSSSFTIAAATAEQLAFVQQPTNTSVGLTVSPPVTVAVEDQFGNVVLTDSSTVALALASGPGGATLGGTTSLAANNGVATFSGLSLNTLGTFTLQATDGVLTPATSNSFIIATVPTQLVILQQPGNTSTGSTLAPAITVAVEDHLGNVVAINTSVVTLAVASGPAGGALSGATMVAAANGVATFSNLVLTVAGTYTLTATDASLTSATTSSFTVSAGPPAKLLMVQGPSNAGAGATFTPPIMVDVEDAFDNLVTTSTTVSLGIVTGPNAGALTGTASVATSGGVATFSNIAIDQVGTYTIDATDGGLSSSPSPSFTISAGSPAKLTFHQEPESTTAGIAIAPAVTVAITDAFGNTVTASSNVTVGIATGPPGSTLAGTTTVAAVNGVATFSGLSLTVSGAYTLEASDSGLTSATSTAFTVNPAAAAHMVIVQQPTGTTAGAVISPAVTVRLTDAYGNLATTDTSSVSFDITPGSGAAGSILLGTTTVPVSGGVATFSDLALTLVGSYTLTAADGSLPTAVSAGFTISPGAPAQLAFMQEPGNVSAGSNLSPAMTVAVLDAYGNLVNTDSSSVTLGIAAGPAGSALTGTLTAAASAGIATFGSVSLHQAGTYTLAAGDGSLTSATSTSFTVAPGPSAQLVLAQGPTNAVAGKTISPAVTVDVEDAYGNIVTTDSSSVTITVATGPAGGALGGTTTVAASHGVATFATLSLAVAGNYTLAATDGSLTSATSGGFTISPGAAAKLVYLQAPSNVVAGVTISPNVLVGVEDSLGNLVTTNSSKVTLGIAPGTGPSGGGATLNGTLTIAAVGGIATFSDLSLDTAASYELRATDGSLALVNSGSFTVSAAAGVRLAFIQQPTNAQAGVALAPAVTVDVEDAFGNIVTTDSSTITLTLTAGGGGATSATLFGTLTQNVVQGVATFGDLSMHTPGTYALQAADGPEPALTSATSGSFTISPGAPAQLVFLGQPGNTVAGNTISPPVTVEVEDAFGNLVTAASSDVTLTLTTSGGGGGGGGSGSPILNGAKTEAVTNGVATFANLSMDQTGTYALKAVDGLLSSAVSQDFTILPGAPVQLVFTQEPTNDSAGLTLTPGVAVAVEDVYGNVVTSDASTVTVALATGPVGGTLDGTLAIAATSGVATFNDLALDTLGTYTMTASDPGEPGLPTITSSSFTIFLGPAAQLAFMQQPASVNAGATIAPSISVAVEDAGGNLVPTDASGVTLGIASGPDGGVLWGSTTAPLFGGVASFTTVALPAAGTYTLTASEGNLTPAISSNINVIGPVAGVSGNGVAITNGATTISTAAGTNFGTAGEGKGTANETFTVTNQGDAPLALGSLSVPGGFVLVTAPAGSILPGASTTFTIGLTEANLGSYSGTVDLSTSDPAANPYTFQVSGTVAPLPSSPSLNTLAAAGPVAKGAPLVLTATGVSVGSPGVIKSVTFYLDSPGTGVFNPTLDKVLGTGKSVGGGVYTLSVATGTLPVGAQNFFVRAEDGYGRYSNSATGAATILDSPPQIAALTLKPTRPAAGLTLTLKATGVSDKYNTVSSVTFYWDPTGTGSLANAVVLGTATAKTGWALTVTLPGASGAGDTPGFPESGTATFLAQAVDAAGTLGNVVVVNPTVASPPVIGQLAVTPTPINSGRPVTFTAGDISDPGSTVSKVQFWLAPAGSAELDTLTDTLLGAGVKKSSINWVLTLKTLQNIAPGDYVVFATAMNASGLWSSGVSEPVTVA